MIYNLVGLFMALQEKMIACGTRLTVIGMVLRFVAGPTAMAIGSIAVGLRGDVLRIAIIQVSSSCFLFTCMQCYIYIYTLKDYI